MDGLSLHYYTFGDERRPRLSATEFDESEWFEVLQARTAHARIGRTPFGDHGSV